MGTVPKRSIPSMAAQMQGLHVADKTEKALMVRVGTLIDAIISAQRGLNNPGQGSRRANLTNLKKPKILEGSTENLFNAVSVTTIPSSSSANQSHQEVQIDTNASFSNPTQKVVFANNTTFKGLIANATYNIRARVVTKDGQISNWAILNAVLTTSSTGQADLDGDSLGATVVSKNFTVSNNSQQFFCGSALGFISIVDSVLDTTAPNTTTSQVKIKDREGSPGFTDVEIITLPGVPRSAMTFIDTGDSNGSFMTVKRNNPLIFFTLITPTVSSYPATRAYDAQIATGAGAYANSTQDTVWVEF